MIAQAWERRLLPKTTSQREGEFCCQEMLFRGKKNVTIIDQCVTCQKREMSDARYHPQYLTSHSGDVHAFLMNE